MVQIEDLLQRRTDLSTFLIHLTRTTEDSIPAREHLLGILTDRTLRRGSPVGLAARQAREHNQTQPAFYDSQRAVSFSESPLEHAWMMCERIDGRQMSFEPYGVAFTKTWGRIIGINPVWYIDITPAGRDWLTKPVNRIVEEAIANHQFDHDIFRITPFIETMGRLSEQEYRRPKEFSWEREWRYVGEDLKFGLDRLVAVLAPENDHAAFSRDLKERRPPRTSGYSDLRYLDPRWGLERMIATLADVPSGLAQPFPPYPPPPT